MTETLRVLDPTGHPAAGAPSAERDQVIVAQRLVKTFRPRHERHTTVRESVLHPLQHSSRGRIPALRDISLEVKRGELFGIVGRNGSGKSTLLRCLAGIYPVDSGELDVAGRVAPFIDLGIGFNPELPARDNVLINAVILGMSPAEARRHFDEIMEFAGLSEFEELKLKDYSSGMQVRLAFSVTVHVKADVLLFDEVLAVSDGAFRQKVLDRFDQMRAEGRTTLLVTHDMSLLERCDRAMLLEAGEVLVEGDPAEVARRYREVNQTPGGSPHPPTPAPTPAPSEGSSALARRAQRAGGVRRALDLAWVLAIAEFKLRYLEARLSFLWCVLRPLLTFGVLYAIFTHVGHLNRGVSHYGGYLLGSLVLWTFFTESTGSAVGSLVRRRDLVRKAAFPRIAVPLSVTLTSMFDLAMNVIAMVIFLVITGVYPRLGWLELPVLVLVLSLLVAGVSMLVSILYIRYRDVDQIWQLVRQVLFYASPTLYVASALPRTVSHILSASPLAAVLTQARQALIDPAAPSAASAVGGGAWLLVPIGIVAILFVTGAVVFLRQSEHIAEIV